MAIKKGRKMPQRTTRSGAAAAALLLISHLAFIKFDFIIVVATVGGDCRTAHG